MDRDALYLLAKERTEKNEQAAAFEPLKHAAELGHVKAQYNLGVFYHQGLGVERSYENAFKFFQLAAEKDHSRAHYMLGCYHAFGLLSFSNKKLAYHHFRVAAEAKVADAQYDLAVMLVADGNPEEAVNFFKLAADAEHSDAQYNLGLLYQQGVGVVPSDELAIYYFQLADMNDHPKAEEALKKIRLHALS